MTESKESRHAPNGLASPFSRLFEDNRFRYLGSYAKKFRGPIIRSILIFCLHSFLAVGGFYMLSLAVDRSFPEEGQIWIVRTFVLYLALYALAQAISIPLEVLGRRLAVRTSYKIAYKMQMDLFEHLQRLPLSYFDNLSTGQVTTRVTQDVSNMRGLYETVFARLTYSALNLLITLSILFWSNFWLTLILFLPVFLMILAMKHYVKTTTPQRLRVSRLFAKISTLVKEYLSNREVLHASAKEEAALGHFEKACNDYVEQNDALIRLDVWANYSLIALIRDFSQIFIIAGIGIMILFQINLSYVATAFLFLTTSQNMLRSLEILFYNVTEISQAYASAEHICELFDEPCSTQLDGPDPMELEPIRTGEVPLLQIEHLSFSYLENQPVLKDLNLEILQGQRIAIVGQTGCGKTTLLSLLLRFYDPEEGRIFYRGRDLLQSGKYAWRKRIGVVLQDPYLVTGTIYSNLSLNHPDLTREKAREILHQIAGETFFERHPLGIDTPVSMGGTRFSSGERQLIAFARALVQDPEILLLDEATANIDSETEQAVQAGIQALQRDRTLVVIAHRLSTIRDSDQIYVLDQGEVREAGTHEELLKKQGLYANYIQQTQQGFGAIKSGSSFL